MYYNKSPDPSYPSVHVTYKTDFKSERTDFAYASVLMQAIPNAPNSQSFFCRQLYQFWSWSLMLLVLILMYLMSKTYAEGACQDYQDGLIPNSLALLYFWRVYLSFCMK